MIHTGKGFGTVNKAEINVFLFRFFDDPTDNPTDSSAGEESFCKAGEFQKNIYFCFIDYAKAFDCVGHNKLWKISKKVEYQTTSFASW